MRHVRRSLWLIAFALITFSVFLPEVQASITPSEPTGPVSPATAIRQARLFEPLILSGERVPADDDALAQALSIYQTRANQDDLSALLSFLDEHPRSPWAPALEANVGLLYLHHGYFSKALDAFRAAWKEGKDAKSPPSKALVDGAVGRLAWLEASLGRNDELAELFEEIKGRAVTGSATEYVQAAAEELALAKNDPRHLFLCGPVALSSLMRRLGASLDQVSFVNSYRASAKGTSLADVDRLAEQQKFSHRLVFRKPGDAVPVPAIVHWKVGHFATIVETSGERFRVEDPVFPGQEIWMTRAALDAEASGYFLVPGGQGIANGWREINLAEAGNVWGKGPSIGTPLGAPGPQDPPTNPKKCSGSSCSCQGMCDYNIGESTVSLSLTDNPVGYTPPIGPAPTITIAYNQREASQPQVFAFFNVGPKWTLNWLSYVTDDPSQAGASVSRYIQGGGAYNYAGYNNTTGEFSPQNNDGSILILASQSPITYQRRLQDGSVELYSQSDGSASYPRNIFLSKIVDPQGNSITLNYDANDRLISLTDATGRQTTFTYGLATSPLLITQITDPFGRSAKFTYDSNRRLTSSTDVLGIKSSFTYDANSLVNSMTTPYGTTNFSYTAPGTSAPPRFVDVEDPLGYHEREEWVEPAPSISDSDPAATVPQGMPIPLTNQYLEYRDSFHWDKDAYVQAGCTITGGCDYTLGRDTHFNHVPPNTNLKSTSIESVKNPLENRVWYVYPGQTNSIYAGTYEKPIATGRVLDDGTTQISQSSYDPVSFNLTQSIDPKGRTTTYTYANHIDLAAVSQLTAYGVQQLVAQFTYNNRHRPIVYTDAAGQTTLYTYNAAQQLASVTNPLGQKTQYQYNATGDLTTIINANNATAASFTYDAYDRVATYTDSEGWTASYNYDDANRITQITYPDGTKDLYTYNLLDISSYQDRQFRKWVYSHDADQRLTAITDPNGKQTLFGYNRRGQLTSLTDPKSNVTNWAYDIQGRLTSKTYADTSVLDYGYEGTTSRLKSITDALSQVKQFSYGQDDRLLGTSYTNAAHPTPNVAFSYDSYYPRLLSMTDGTGTSQYAYGEVGSLGALQLQQTTSPLANSTISYAYDELSRLTSQTVAGSGMQTFQYDTIDRLISDTNDLGAFTLAYLGQTKQITTRQLSSSTLATTWSYLPNAGDRRLSGINNVGLSSGQYSTYQYTTTPENLISGITEASDATTVYPSVLTQTASYNNLNQLTNLSGQTLTFDANGNVLSDGQRNYSWDAENRLVGITYPGQPGKATTFTYDGLSRRTAIASTPTGGGTATTISYIWCGISICQARNAAGATTREYFSEGEFVPGSPAQTYYYGVDQIGSVRRAFASTSSAPAFSYDPYGNALQSSTPLTDFNYAGMFYNADSGLYLTQYRAYDPSSGRWLSRDLRGELNENYFARVGFPVFSRPADGYSSSDKTTLPSQFGLEWRLDKFIEPNEPAVKGVQSVAPIVSDAKTWTDSNNLYGYVSQNPISDVDPNGLAPGDRRFGLSKRFWRWYHRCYKEPGDPDLTFEDACDIHDYWCSIGKPDAP